MDVACGTGDFTIEIPKKAAAGSKVMGVYLSEGMMTLRYASNAIQVGQISSGGGGLPMTHYLPNGWCVIFASNILLDVDKNHIEPGIAPDFEAEIGDYQNTRKDGVVEKAIEELLKMI